MKVQALVLDPIRDMAAQVFGYLPTLFTSLAILLVGYVAARLITKLLVKLLRTVEFDKISDTIGLTNILKIGEIKDKPSTIVGCVAYWVMMVMVLIMTVRSFGLALANDFLTVLFSYIPHVIIGTLVLIIGMLLANVISTIVYVTAKNSDMPGPDTLKHVTKMVITAYVAIVFLKEIGFVALFEGINYTIFMTGVVFAIALSFGLAGKDIAAKYLDVFKR